MRPLPGAPVSVPVTWEEIADSPPRFSMRTIGRRLAEVGDLFRPILTMAQDLRRAAAELQSYT